MNDNELLEAVVLAMLTRTGIGTSERAVVHSARKVVAEIRQAQRFPDTSESL